MIGRADDSGSSPPLAQDRALTDADRLRSVARTGLDATADNALDRFARLVSGLLKVPVALVSLVDAERQFFPGAVGLAQPWAAGRETPLSHSFCQHVVDTGAPMVLTDARQEPLVSHNLAIPDLGVIAYAGMPLTDLDGRVLGSLCAIDQQPRIWTGDELQVLADLAAACSSEIRLRIALDGAESARRLAEQANEQLATLAGLTETLAGTLDIPDALARVADAIVPQLADWCLISVSDPGGELRDLAAAHRDPDRTHDVARFAALTRTDLGPEAVTRQVLRTGRPVLHGSTSPAELSDRVTRPELPILAARLGYASQLTVPIPAAGRPGALGVVTLINGPDRRPLTDDDLRTAVDIGRRAGLAIGNSRLYREQRHVAEVLQHSMLPALPQISPAELEARYLPAASRVEVGGDWYDAFVQPNGDLIATIGDVAGHDVEAAALMGQLRNLVRGNAYGRHDAVGVLMTQLEEAIRGLRLPTIATATLVRLRQTADGAELTWSNAGHPPPLMLRSDGAVETLATPVEPLLGLLLPTPRSTHTTRLAPGDTLLLYTDGLVEQRSRIIDDGIAELRDRLASHPGLALDKLCDTLLSPAGSREDDVALLAIRAR